MAANPKEIRSIGEEGVVAKVLIIVPNYWGKGDTITDAWNNVKKESFKSLRELEAGPHSIYTVFDRPDKEAYSQLDEMGFNTSYPEGYPPIRIEHKDS